MWFCCGAAHASSVMPKLLQVALYGMVTVRCQAHVFTVLYRQMLRIAVLGQSTQYNPLPCLTVEQTTCREVKHHHCDKD